MGKSMDRQKNFRCLVLGVVSLASTREAPGPDQATQRNLVNEGGTPHAARQARHFNSAATSMCGTAPPGPPRTHSHAHQPAKQDDWATPLAFVPPEIGSTHAQERSTGESRLGTFPATVGKPSWLGVLAPNLVMADQDCIPSREHYSTQSSILVQPLLGCNYRAEALGSDQQPFPDDDDAPPRRSCRPRTRTLRFRPRIASSLVSDIPLSTELRRGKFQMPAKLHPGVEVHGDAKTATGSERHDSGSRISMNPRGTSTPAPAPAPAQAQTG